MDNKSYKYGFIFPCGSIQEVFITDPIADDENDPVFKMVKQKVIEKSKTHCETCIKSSNANAKLGAP